MLVKCCNLKSQVLNKSSLFSLLFNNLVLELLLTQQSGIRARQSGTMFVVLKTVFFEGVHSTHVQSETVKLVVWDQAYLVE